MDTHAKGYPHQLGANTGCYLKDLLSLITDMDGWCQINSKIDDKYKEGFSMRIIYIYIYRERERGVRK